MITEFYDGTITFEQHWGMVDWKDKIVLDIGADFGSTAERFIYYGSLKVLVNNIKLMKLEDKIIPILLQVEKAEELKQLLTSNKYDVVKIDCEGCEKFLPSLPDDIINAKIYAIECHSNSARSQIIEKLQRLKYNLFRTMTMINY